MKKHITILALLFTFFAFMSCEKVLDEELKTDFLPEDLFQTESGLEIVANGLYSTYTDFGYKGTKEWLVHFPHSGKFWSAQNVNIDATRLQISSNNINLIEMWAKMYETINNANTIISRLETQNQNFENRDRILGYAYFIRGIVYFDLVRYFGGVPLRTEPTTINTIHKAKASKEAVYAAIIEDFTKASNLLPDNAADNGNRTERPLKFAADMYLAKTYITLASEPGADASLWVSANDALLPVIGQYSLTPTYAELFEPTNENSQESIFELNFSIIEGDNNFGLTNEFTPEGEMPGQTFARLRPNKETFKEHVERYGLNGGTLSEGSDVVLDPTYADPRINGAYFYNNHIKFFGTTTLQNIYPRNLNGKNGYAAIKKYVDPAYIGNTTSRNLIQLRYADALLMMAEIQNEISGPSAGYAFVNQVLTRARDLNGDGTSDTVQPADWDATNVPDQATFRDLIMKERRFELIGEGHVWFDVRRRGLDYFKNNVINPHITTGNQDVQYPMDDATISAALLLPISQEEINSNQLLSQSDQNPGY